MVHFHLFPYFRQKKREKACYLLFFFIHLQKRNNFNEKDMEQDDYDIHCTKLFEEGIRSRRHGDTVITTLCNKQDCFILYIPPKAEQQFRKHFMLKADERILLARDTSTWNRRNEGLVMTNKRIIFIPRHYVDNKELYIIRFNSFMHVTSNAHSVLFWHTETSFFAIPKRFFFKPKWKSYDFDRAIAQLGDILERMSTQRPHGKIIPIACNLHKYAEA